MTFHDTAIVIGNASDPFTVSGIDNFEDNDLDEYLGDTGLASISTSAYEGSYAAELSSSALIYSLPGDSDPDLPNYPAQGDIFETRMYSQGGEPARFVFGVQDSSNYYYAEADPAAGSLTLYVKSAGSDTELASTTGLSILTGEWLRLAVEWKTDGTQIVQLFDASGTEITSGGISATDATYSSGGIGFGQ